MFQQTTEEGSTVSCVIERVRGSLDFVFVNYTVTQLDSLKSDSPAHEDFANATGAVVFTPGQRSEVCQCLESFCGLGKILVVEFIQEICLYTVHRKQAGNALRYIYKLK